MKFRYSRMLAALVVSAVMVAGCGSNQQQAGDVSVNAYKITASDAQVNQTYAGTVVAENSVAVHARVSGYVVEKYVKGGEQVVAGQPLYRILVNTKLVLLMQKRKQLRLMRLIKMLK